MMHDFNACDAESMLEQPVDGEMQRLY